MKEMSVEYMEAIVRELYEYTPPEKVEASNDSLTEALFLYGKGFNIFPVEYGQKEVYKKWGVLKSARLPEEKIPELFEGQNNIAVLTGKLSNNLFVIDCDNPAVFKEYLDLLESKNLAKWVVSTSRGGHIWLLSQDGEVNNCKLKNVDVRSNNQYVISPPSLNEKTGVFYSWLKREGNLPPSLSSSEIHEIFPQLTITLTLKGCLPNLVHEVLVNKNTLHYASNSEAENAAVFSLIRLGWDDVSIIQLFNHFSPPHYSSRRHSEDWLTTNMLEPAREIIQAAPHMKQLKNAVSWAEAHTWNNRTASTDKQVFLACCKRGMIEGINNFRATEREVGELANITRQTARNSLRRLVQEGILETTPDKSTGTHYKITEEAQGYPNKATVIYIIGVMSSSLINHDVWHPKALGKTAYSVYQYLLTDNCKTIQEISSGIQKSEEAVKRALGRMDESLVSQREDKWEAVNNLIEYHNYLAEKLGTLGIAQRRVLQHIRDRENKSYALFIKN